MPSSSGNGHYTVDTVELAGPGGDMDEIMSASAAGVTVLREFSCTCRGYQFRHECKHSSMVANLVADVNDEFGYE